MFRHPIRFRCGSPLNPRESVSFRILASFEMPRLVIRYFHLPLSPIRSKKREQAPNRKKKKRRGTSFLGQIGIGRCERKEGRKEGTVVEGAIDGCQTAFQASYPYRECSPRKDIVPLGRGWVGRSTMVDGHRDGAEKGGMQKGRGPDPGVCRVLQIIQLAPRIKVCIFIALR